MKRLAILSSLLLASLAMAAPVLAAPPANDLYTGSAAIALGDAVTLDTTEATTDADDAEANTFCGAPATDASVWYEFTATADAWVAVDVSASSYTAGVIVVTGSPGSFELQNCGPGATAFQANSGQTYAILAFDDQFDGAGNGGTLELAISEIPPPPEIALTVDKSGRFDSKTGAAIISGTVTCTGGPAEFSFIDVFVRQAVGRFFIDGYGFIEGFTCDGTTQAWSVEVFGFNGIFKGGKALSATFAVACGTFLCGIDYQEHIVQLKGKK